MTYEYLKHLKATNQTIRLLGSDNFAFMLGFFYYAFVKQSHMTLTHSEIVQMLDDYLFDLNRTYENILPKSAKEYLDDFSDERHAYLRKYHGEEDEPLYELTPAASKALEFVESLQKNEFVTSRSKFNIIFELLEELEFETKMDDVARIEKLEQEKATIDRQIAAIRSHKDLRFDTARIKEHYLQIAEIVRKLSYDFSEMEYNFRDLNRMTMEEIALREENKSSVLDSVFEIEDKIRESPQGKSFFAFWQLMTDRERSEKLSEMLSSLYEVETIAEMDREHKLEDVQYSLLKSGEKIYGVSLKLIEQLRRFIDDRVWIENRRVLELCKSIEKKAIGIKESVPANKNFFSMAGDRVLIDSIDAKRLYEPRAPQHFVQYEREEEVEIDMESFYHTFYVDEELLKRNISQLLLRQKQCSLLDVVEKFEITKGISELVGYLSIAKNSETAYVDEQEKVTLEIREADGVHKRVTLPKIVFSKGVTS